MWVLVLLLVQGPEPGQGPGLDKAAGATEMATEGTEVQVEPASNENGDLHGANRSSRAKTL